MTFYPKTIESLAEGRNFVGRLAAPDAVGRSASFQCGSFVRYHLAIDPGSLTIDEIRFQSNGCGYAVAAAVRIAESCVGKPLRELGGLGSVFETAHRTWLSSELPPERVQCLDIAEEAIRDALGNYRLSRIQEFKGEKALICSCFGVDEDKIERAISDSPQPSVEQVGMLTNAGTGCGSCRMLIQEIIDDRAR